MKIRTASIISLCAILAYIAEIYLFRFTAKQFLNPGDDIYFFFFYGLIFFTLSLILASAISGVLGFFSMRKRISIWLFLGIFIAGAACTIGYLFVLW